MAEYPSAQTALDSIFDVMDGKQWSPDTLDAIAEILTDAGYVIHPPEDR